MASHLFSPVSLRGLELPNRVVVSPMGMGSSEQDWYVMHFGNLAVSGAGLLIVGATAVNPEAGSGRKSRGLWNDSQAEFYQPMISFCRKHGNAKIGIQLQHTGRKGSVASAFEGRRFVSKEEGGWQTVAPSAIAYPGYPAPRELSQAEISGLVADFARAATRADGAGFDLLEIHSAHGYLLHQFLSPVTNRRTDDYGGNLSNRMRFPLEVFSAVRAVWPDRKPLGIRVSATDWIDGGLTLEDTVSFAEALAQRGCDYITASSGGIAPEQKITVKPGYQVDFAAAIRKQAGIKTIAVGLITETRQAEAILDEGKADLVAIGREMLYNPRWAWHAAMALGEPFYYPPQYERSHPRMRSGDFLAPKPTA